MKYRGYIYLLLVSAFLIARCKKPYAPPAVSSGAYASADHNLDNSRKYHLHVITAAGQEYLSDYESVKINPPIGNKKND
jgi:hypothetical protein